MERLVQELVSYRSVDGKTFDTPTACEAHERSLPRAVVYALTYPDRARSSATGAYAYGYTTVTERTEFESPAFLRAGGDVTVEDRTDTVLGVALGPYDAVLRHAVENDAFWRNRKEAFIREIAFTDLRETRR